MKLRVKADASKGYFVVRDNRNYLPGEVLDGYWDAVPTGTDRLEEVPDAAPKPAPQSAPQPAPQSPPPAQPAKAKQPGPSAEELDELTREQLYDLADKRGLDLTAGLRKDQLIEAITELSE
jgi:Rho termination factor, N-terminal domain